MANTNKARKTFTDLSNPQQLRELNRQLEWVWNQLLGGLPAKAFSNTGMKTVVSTVEKTIAQEIEAETVTTSILKAALAEMMVAQIGVAQIDLAQIVDLVAENAVFRRGEAGEFYADFFKATTANMEYAEIDFSKLKDLMTDDAIITAGQAGELYIERLAATSSMLLSAVIGNLVVKGDDGEYYTIAVSSDGTIHTSAVEVSDDEIDAGQLITGKPIVEASANIRDLNAQSIKGSSAIISEIFTTALTAGKITAGEALIASATIPALYTTTIKAIGETLDLSANTSITSMVGGKATVYRSENPPSEANTNDLWIQPSNGYTFQLTGNSAALPTFYLDGDGYIYYAYGDNQTVYAVTLDENGDLYFDEEAPFAIAIDENGEPVWWQRVRDSEWVKSIGDTAAALETQINASYSELEQRADKFEASINTLTAQGEELRTYMRYGDGILELGRSDSRYTTQTSDRGFVVLQGGVEMASMKQNTISAPVINAQRMFTIGEHGIRLGASGHLIIN